MLSVLFMLALPIFPVCLQTSIFGAGELNFRVRYGNGWTLTAINTNYFPPKRGKLNFRLSTERHTALHREWCAFTDSNRGPTD